MKKTHKAKNPKKASKRSKVEIREMGFNDLPAVFDLGERLFTPEKRSNLCPYQFLRVGMILLCAAILIHCETSQSLTKKRIKAVEKGLLKAVVFEGQKPEKMRLSERMQYYRVPGVSMAVMDKYQIEWAKSYGFKEEGSSEPITPETLFQAASLSQPVSVVAALHLVDEGKLSLDREANTLLKSWKIPENEFTRKEKVTLRRLLNHTAGLISIEYRGYSQDDKIPSLMQILNGKKPANAPALYIQSLPGAAIRYSEGGYAILQQLLLDITGKSFPEIAEDVVLNPLEMKNSSFQDPLPSDLRRSAATGHDQEGKRVEGKWNRYPETAASGLWSTPSDLAVFALAVMETAVGRSQKVISPPLARTMLTPQMGDRGLGFYVKDERDNLHFLLGGNNKGFECIMVAYPARGQGAVIMTNSDNGAFLIDEILRGISTSYEWPHFKPEVKKLYRLLPSVYEQYVGRYEVNPDYILNVSHEDYYLIIQPTGQAPTKFFVESQTIFFSTNPYIEIHFVRDSEGKVSELILNQRGTRLVARKVKE